MRDPLAILICGAMINALCGLTGQVMTLCHGHRALLGQTLVIQGAALALLPPAIAWDGARGAALVSTLAVLAGNLVAVGWIRRWLGVDPGIGGLIWPVGGDRRGWQAAARTSAAAPDA